MSWVTDPSADATIDDLLPGARRIVTVSAGITAGETVVIVTDPARPADIAAALSRAVEEVGAVPITIVMPVAPSGAEPPAPVTAAMSTADVILAPTSGAIYHTVALRTATAAGARFIALTGYIKDVLVRGGVFADFPTIGPKATWLAERMTNATSAHITAPSGTDLRASLDGRTAIPINGFVRNPGDRSANPDVEAFIAPIETSIDGAVVVDASASIVGVLSEPLQLTVERGRVVAIEGGPAADAIRDALSATNHPDAFTLAELAIGLNPDGIIRGVIVEDEGVAGTGHVAIGSNIHFGGVSAPPIHLDFVFHKPTLTLDGEVVVADGELQDGAVESAAEASSLAVTSALSTALSDNRARAKNEESATILAAKRYEHVSRAGTRTSARAAQVLSREELMRDRTGAIDRVLHGRRELLATDDATCGGPDRVQRPRCRPLLLQPWRRNARMAIGSTSSDHLLHACRRTAV